MTSVIKNLAVRTLIVLSSAWLGFAWSILLIWTGPRPASMFDPIELLPFIGYAFFQFPLGTILVIETLVCCAVVFLPRCPIFYCTAPGLFFFSYILFFDCQWITRPDFIELRRALPYLMPVIGSVILLIVFLRILRPAKLGATAHIVSHESPLD